ncbi:MAG: hypothetical protein ACHQ1H_03695, partial [Nitrososphaerales archaeon]
CSCRASAIVSIRECRRYHAHRYRSEAGWADKWARRRDCKAVRGNEGLFQVGGCAAGRCQEGDNDPPSFAELDGHADDFRVRL